MAAKRQPDQEGTDDRNLQSPLQDSNREEIFRTVRNVLFSPLFTTELPSYFEPVIRKVVREEVSFTIQRYLGQSSRTTLNQTERYGARAFQLCFVNQWPSSIYTFSELTAKDGAPIQIALCDATAQNSIVTNAPQSSMKIEICPLDGEFSNDDWTPNEFNANIIRQRQNKGPLLSGDKFVILKNGIGFIKVMFTDNSSWIRSGKFRIGAKIVDSAEAKNIKEARSDPFRVKDCRGKACKKHDCPSLNDPIWRLEKIAKDGKIHQHLSSQGIGTVEDLLHLLMTNPASLEQIFGNIPRKSKEKIIEHAKACRELNDMRCGYLMEGRPVVLEREPSPSNDFMAIDEPSPNSSMNSMATSQQVQAAAESSNPDHGLQQSVTFEQGMWGVLSQPSNIWDNQVGTDQQPDWRVLLNSPIDEEFLSGMHVDGNNACPIAGSETLFSNYLPPSTGNDSHFASGYGAGFINHSPLPKFCGHASSSRGNRKKLWQKIRNALKWVRLYAAKRNEIKLPPFP